MRPEQRQGRSRACAPLGRSFPALLVDKIMQMIPSAFEDFREVSRCCEGTKRQICTTSPGHYRNERRPPARTCTVCAVREICCVASCQRWHSGKTLHSD